MMLKETNEPYTMFTLSLAAYDKISCFNQSKPIPVHPQANPDKFPSSFYEELNSYPLIDGGLSRSNNCINIGTTSWFPLVVGFKERVCNLGNGEWLVRSFRSRHYSCISDQGKRIEDKIGNSVNYV